MFSLHYSLVKDKNSPNPPQKEEVEETSALENTESSNDPEAKDNPVNSESNSPTSNTLDTIDSQDENYNNDEDIYDDTDKNTENKNNGKMSDKCDDDVVAKDSISGVANDAVENTESSSDVVAGTKTFVLEPVDVKAEAKDHVLIPLGDEVFVDDPFADTENYKFCFCVRADKLNVYLTFGYVYPDRGMFAYGAYIEADALSSLKLVFFDGNLTSFRSITWKYFTSKGYPSATQQYRQKVNF